MYYRTEGVILNKRNFSEADRLLTIYTRDSGKISALAKGVRRPRSKKSGHLEIGNWCKLFVAKGKNLDIITEVELKKAFGIANFKEEKAVRIYHLLELVDLLTAPHQKNKSVFILLVQFLKKIVDQENFNLLSTVFKIKLLSLLGFFSAKNLSFKSKKFFEIIENQEFEQVKEKVNLAKSDYLKLSRFLDSMIEDLASRKINTTRFLNG